MDQLESEHKNHEIEGVGYGNNCEIAGVEEYTEAVAVEIPLEKSQEWI